jgi:hypothetical protein
MADLSYIKKMSELPSQAEIEQAFGDVLTSSNDRDKEEISRLLYHLALTQWNSYAFLKKELREKVLTWVNKNWDVTSIELTKNIIYICRFLGLKEINEKLEQLRHLDVASEIKSQAEEDLKLYIELQGDIYHGMYLLEKIDDNNLEEVLKLPDGIPTKLILDYLNKILDYAEAKDRNLSDDQVDDAIHELRSRFWPRRIVDEQLKLRLERWLKREAPPISRG